MSIESQIERIIRIDGLIRLKATGNPKELSNKLSMSERNVYKVINTMKNIGAPITFCEKNNSFVYSEEVEFKIFRKKSN